MSTAVLVYQVSASNASNQVKSSVIQIQYIDQAGVNQRINATTPNGTWSLTFPTFTVGQPYGLNAVEVQSDKPGQVVTVTVLEAGSSVATANNGANTKLPAGVTGTA